MIKPIKKVPPLSYWLNVEQRNTKGTYVEQRNTKGTYVEQRNT